MCWYDGKRKKNEKKNYRCAEYDGEKKEQKNTEFQLQVTEFKVQQTHEQKLKA